MSFHGTDLMSLDVHTNDPWPFYQWLLEQEPLYWDEQNKLWAVSRYDDVVFVSKNTGLFCSGKGVIPNLDLSKWPDEAMINLDGAAHTKQRGLVSKGFTPRRIAALEDSIRAVCKEMLDAVEPRGAFDLVKDLARPLPMRIIGQMLGYPEDMMLQVLDWTDVFAHAGSGPDHVTPEVMTAFMNFGMFHTKLLAERKKERGDDLLSIWLDAELDGEKLTEQKLMYEHNLLLVGGSETTRTAISAGIKAMLERPDQHRWMVDHVDNEDAITNAVEEMIRFSCPFVRMKRTALKDVEMHGKTIREGDQIIMLYPAANRDPRVFDNPMEFDVQRSFERPQLAFGFGKHFCLGAALARLETKVVLESVLRRFPNLHLTPQTEAVPHPSCFVRSLESCPVTITEPAESAA